jgi:hypothetical protein
MKLHLATKGLSTRFNSLFTIHINELLQGVHTQAILPYFEVEVTLRLTISQYVLASSTLVGLATRDYFMSECCCLKFAVLYLRGALSDERTGLQSVV